MTDPSGPPELSRPPGELPPSVARLAGARARGRLRGVDLRIAQGECTVLVGPNGAGKSSVLRALTGLLPLDSGEAWLDTRPVVDHPERARAAKIAWLPQRPRLSSDLTVRELVMRGRFRFDESFARTERIIAPILLDTGLSELAQRRVTEISGGELQRALIATLIAQQSPLLLVDEPANHLDPRHQIDTYHRLGHLWQSGQGLCVVTHDIRLCQLLGPKDRIQVVGLSEGAIHFRRSLADPELVADLAALYGVNFLPQDTPGALAVSLSQEVP